MAKKKSKKFRRFEREKKRPKLDLHPQTQKNIWGIVLVALFLISLLIFAGQGGVAGNWINEKLSNFSGKGRYIVSTLFLASALIFFRSLRRNISYSSTFIGSIVIFLSFLSLLEIGSKDSHWGGDLGAYITCLFERFLGTWVTLILFLTALIIGFLIAFNPLFTRPKKPDEFTPKTGGPPELFPERKPKIYLLLKKIISRPSSFKIKKIEKEIPGGVSIDLEKFLEAQKEEEKEPLHPRIKYQKPSLELLEPDRGEPTSGDIKANANIIKRTLQNFGIEVEMGEVSIGPTVTQYTLKPAEGVKLSKITTLVNDLSLALAAHPLRIEAPIPGKALVGIEIPNKQVKFVRLRDLLQNPNFSKAPSTLTFPLGRDVAGNPIFTTLEKMPHLLIAGSTGSGKTIALNSLIISLLYRNSPKFLRFVLIDPKRVEFPIYNNLPHLLAPVITNVQKTINALKWLVGEMERRFGVLAEANARDIGVYNTGLLQKIRDGEKEYEDELLPYIILIVDELADLMAARPREVEASIVRLAQMARAVGIHLVVATQRPSVDVITGLIKANITSRVAFQVASQVDSRTILDMAGAEKLLGNGDMLFLSAETSKPKRIQGVYVSEKEVKKVADFLKKVSKEGVEYNEEVLEGELPGEELSTVDESFDRDKDPLYEEAKKVIVRSKKASASLLQRRLSIGYARAARLLDIMEEEGIVGPVEGAKPREVYIRDDEDR